MTRQISRFSIFCIVAAILSAIYLLIYRFVLADIAAANYDSSFSALKTLLFLPLFSFSFTGAIVSVISGQWLKSPPAALRMMLLLLPILFLVFFLAFVLLNLSGSLPASLAAILNQMDNPFYFSLAAILFSFGIFLFCRLFIFPFTSFCPIDQKNILQKAENLRFKLTFVNL